MPITPISPVDQERLVPETTSIILESDAQFTQVIVGIELAFLFGDFQDGWQGEEITLEDGIASRLVLTPDVPFVTGQIIVVNAISLTGVTTITFEVGSRQITTTNDATVPRTVQAADDTWIAYVREPGNIVVRKDNPLTGETIAIAGDEVECGFDPVLNKFVLLWVHNEKIFYSLADPTDAPAPLIQPSILVDDQLIGHPGPGNAGGVSLETFPPIKQTIIDPDDQVAGPIAVGNGYDVRPRWTSPTPLLVSVPPDPVVVRIPRPTTLWEAENIVYVRLFKVFLGTARIVGVFPFPEGVSFIDVDDDRPTPGATYTCTALYRRGDGGELDFGRRSGGDATPTGASVTRQQLGVGNGHSVVLETFPPIKQLVIDPDPQVSPEVGSGNGWSVFIEGFGPIGVG